MPQHDKSHELPSAKPQSMEGAVFEIKSPADLDKAVREAFDYRGDVTVTLKSGQVIEGFFSNYDYKRNQAQVFVQEPENKRNSSLQTVALDDIVRIAFTGGDIAFGKSWEDWMTKSEKERAKEAELLAAKSKELGHL
jgi:hypothetical protein